MRVFFYFLLGALFLVVLQAVSFPEPTQGQELRLNAHRTEAHLRTRQLALARIMISESGFQTDTMDGRLIYEVLKDRGHGELTMGVMRAYATKTFSRRRTDSRRWIPFLTADGREPQWWRESTRASWAVRRRGFERVYHYAGYLIRHDPPYPCTLPVHHWGARGFRTRMRISEGWRRVECGETRNQFWMIPARIEPEARVCTLGQRYCE